MTTGSDRPTFPQHLTITTAPSPSGTLTITVTGDLERDTATTFRHHLTGILDGHHAGDLDIDLSAVEFCDLAGLRLLYALERATDGSHQVRITAASPAVDVLLQLCDTPALLGYTPPPRPYRH
ncbi:STAS domain-containing protein [Actinoplanes sp. NPDC051346]|uniref:STAS domain-containing protein n=1 Tax=Actinoplanes sp. NPDC051346 TaxID=3155048 RepID=UPI00344A9F7E